MITPLDIENKKFSKQMMNGYNVDEVDDFLDEIMADYEANYKELAVLRPKVDELNTEILLKNREVEDIKKQFDIYKAKMESLLISQLELLKEINSEDKE